MTKRSVQVEIFAAGDGINYPRKVCHCYVLNFVPARRFVGLMDVSASERPLYTERSSPAFLRIFWYAVQSRH